MTNFVETQQASDKTILIGTTTYTYLSTEYSPYTKSNEYLLRSNDGKSTVVRVKAWAKRADLFSVYDDSNGCSFNFVLWLNPVTKKLEDASHRFVKSFIAMDDSRKETHGIVYYRTPDLFDGNPV